MKLLAKLATVLAAAAMLAVATPPAPAEATPGQIRSATVSENSAFDWDLPLPPAPYTKFNDTQTSPTGASGNVVVLKSNSGNVRLTFDQVPLNRQLIVYLNGVRITDKTYLSGKFTGISVANWQMKPHLRIGWNSFTTNLSSVPFKVFAIPTTPSSVYNVPGFSSYGGREWATACEKYSQTVRCSTYILSNNKWVFNNLSYLPGMTQAQWGSNPLANNASWTSSGYQWYTECNTPRTGSHGCRTYILKGGKWVLNSMVQFRH